MFRVFIGYDRKEHVAFNVLANSIYNRANRPVAISRIDLRQIGNVLKRTRHPLQSTEFSFSRFLTPYLSGYEGWSVFMDCDMLVLDDITKLESLFDESYAVRVVKHVHVPAEEIKFLGTVQTKYEKKNWSSFMLFNNRRCKMLTPDYVNGATGLDLHQFKWLDDERLIGDLPSAWNHLVGYDRRTDKPSNVHYTVGGPYFEQYSNVEYSQEWFSERDDMLIVTKP